MHLHRELLRIFSGTYWSSPVTTYWPLDPQSLLGPEILARATYQLLAVSNTGSSNNIGYFSLEKNHIGYFYLKIRYKGQIHRNNVTKYFFIQGSNMWMFIPRKKILIVVSAMCWTFHTVNLSWETLEGSTRGDCRRQAAAYHRYLQKIT